MRICLQEECHEPTLHKLCRVRTGHHYPAMNLDEIQESLERWERLRVVFPKDLVERVLERRREAQSILSAIVG